LIQYVLYFLRDAKWTVFIAIPSFIFILVGVTHKPHPDIGDGKPWVI